jgi:hypothetical protein
VKKKLIRKIFTFLSIVTILVQSLSPFLVLTAKAYADEVNPVSSTDNITPTEVPAQTAEVTPTPEVLPTIDVSPTPEISSVPTEEVLPTIDETTTVPPTDQSQEDVQGVSTTQDQPSNSNNQNNTVAENTTASNAADATTEPITKTGNETLEVAVLDNVSAPTIDLGAAQQGSATLSTDKPDYAPTDTALITGANLLPNTVYTLMVSSSNSPPVNFSTNVTSDENGVFVYAYQLDGNYRPNYFIELKDQNGEVVATTTFTDSESSTATVPFSDSFGSSNSSSVTNWDEHDPAEILGQDNTPVVEDTTRDGNVSNKFAKIGEGGWIRRTINATGFQTLQLKYYWKGDDDASSGDRGRVEYCAGATCTSFTELTYHQLGPSSPSWSTQQIINLPSSLNNSTFRIRFRDDSNSSDEYFRVDQVEVTGSASNSAPTDIALSSSSIEENQSVNTVVGNFTTTDLNIGDTFTYSLVSGTGSTDNASFNINGAQLRTSASFDYETKNSYSIRVRTTDQGSLSFEKVFTISVTDVVEIPPFFSEYIEGSFAEGSSYNKALEIYNPTNSAIDLAAGGYKVEMYFNGGSSVGRTINLAGVIPANGVFVLAHPAAGSSILAKANQVDSPNNVGWFNGDDAVVLKKGSSILDVIGQIGYDPGSEWGTGLTSTTDHTLVRKCSVTQGDTNGSDSFNPATQWDGYAVNTFSYLGSHVATCPSDTTPPVLSLPSNMTVEATGPAGAVVTYIATANDAVDGSVTVICNPTSGSTFPIGQTTVNCNASDSHGNTANGSFKITVQDTTAPITTPSVYSASYTWGTWTNAQKTIRLTCDDSSGSGCVNTHYCTDSTNSCSPTTTYTGQFGFSTEGISYIRFYSTDNTGNTETIKSVQIKIDTSRPVTNDDYVAKDGVWQNSDQTITLTASDTGSGLQWTKYCFGNTIDVNGVVCYPDTDSSSITCPNPASCSISVADEGKKYLAYQSQDNAGNKTQFPVIRFIRIDKTAPSLSANPPAGDYDSDQLVSLISSDSASGLAGVYYTIDGSTPDSDSTPYTAPITVDKDMTIKAIAYDNAGNTQILEATYGIPPIISGESFTRLDDNVLNVTWVTDDPSTSRVIYDTVSHSELGDGPNYGYAFSTDTFNDDNPDPKTFSHSVTITGVNVNQTYYYRVISHGSPEAVGNENPFSTYYVYGLAGDGFSDGKSDGRSSGGGGVSSNVLGVSTVASTGVGEGFVLDTETGAQEEVLGTQSASPTPTVTDDSSSSVSQQAFLSWVMSGHKKIATLILLVIILLVLYFFYFMRKRKKDENK